MQVHNDGWQTHHLLLCLFSSHLKMAVFQHLVRRQIDDVLCLLLVRNLSQIWLRFTHSRGEALTLLCLFCCWHDHSSYGSHDFVPIGPCGHMVLAKYTSSRWLLASYHMLWPSHFARYTAVCFAVFLRNSRFYLRHSKVSWFSSNVQLPLVTPRQLRSIYIYISTV